MKWTVLPLLASLAAASVVQAASPADSPSVGRYQLGGTERDGLILIDTATGRTWKFSRDVRPAANEPVWIPLRFPEAAAPPATVSPSAKAMPQDTPAEQPWLAPGPYRDKRPGGK